MKRWEKYQTRIANAKTARKFIVTLLTCYEHLNTDCTLQRLKGECDSRYPTKCEVCMLEWLNADIKEGE